MATSRAMTTPTTAAVFRVSKDSGGGIVRPMYHYFAYVVITSITIIFISLPVLVAGESDVPVILSSSVFMLGAIEQTQASSVL